MKNNVYIYLFIMGGVSYLIRSLPMTLIRKEIKNPFIKSFLYYVPYVTLSAMTFPAIIYATQSMISGAAALVVGIIVAYFKEDLVSVALMCSLTVFVIELFII